jgi:hypothetical protein
MMPGGKLKLVYKTDTPNFRFWIYTAIENTTNGNAVLSPGLYCTYYYSMTSKNFPYLSNINANF